MSLALLTPAVVMIIIIGGRCIRPEVVDLPAAPGAPVLATGPLTRGRLGLLEVVVDGPSSSSSDESTLK